MTSQASFSRSLTSVLLLYGTRPEAIKLAPVIKALLRRPERFRTTVCVTAQHRGMLDQVNAVFGIFPERDLDLMRPGQRLNDLTARIFAALDPVFDEVMPDWVLVQGDTTSAAAVTLAAFHRQIPVGHVEAGLRTGDLAQPFPEEANRRIIDLIASAHFAPTVRARQALLAEGTDPSRLHLTGNTVVDALQVLASSGHVSTRDEVLVTVHRRETFGEPLERIFTALRILAKRFDTTRWIFPVHPNPHVREPAHRLLTDLPNLEMHEPFEYPELVRRLQRCRIVLTDSGGIQEEAPAFAKPVLVLRNKTERPEGVEAGVARLVGDDTERIVSAVAELLTNPATYEAMARIANPYGDGSAAERIVAVLAGEPYQPFRSSAAREDLA